MGSQNRNFLLVVCLILSLFLVGCELLDLYTYKDTKSLEEYGDKVAMVMATLLTYIGKNQEEVKKNFGEPSEVEQRSGRISTYYQEEKVPFDEIWYYIYRRGIPGINAEGSMKIFFFNQGKVVSVDAS